MTQEYTLDSLIKTFEQHDNEYEAQKKQWLDTNGSDMPYADFSVPRAFLCILNEIKELKCQKEKE